MDTTFKRKDVLPVAIAVASSGDEGIETKEKKKESIAEKNERKGEEADKIQKEEEGALIGLGKMFSEDGKD